MLKDGTASCPHLERRLQQSQGCPGVVVTDGSRSLGTNLHQTLPMQTWARGIILPLL